MSLPIRAITADFCVAPQLEPTDMAIAVSMGFKTIINNRPDAEGGPAQPASSLLQDAAAAAGVAYVYLPVTSGTYTQEQVQAMAAAVASAAKPVLAFCRSGARSTQLYQLAQSA